MSHRHANWLPRPTSVLLSRGRMKDWGSIVREVNLSEQYRSGRITRTDIFLYFLIWPLARSVSKLLKYSQQREKCVLEYDMFHEEIRIERRPSTES